MNPTRSELDTFKVMSNNDYVDWSRASKLYEVEEEESEDTAPVTVHVEPEAAPEKVEEAPPEETIEEQSLPREKEPDVEPEGTTRLEDLPNFAPFEREPEPSRQEEPKVATLVEEEEVDKPEFVPQARPAFRAMPKARKYTASEENEDYEVLAEKESLLQELLQIERTQNIKLARKWSVEEHTLDELQFEYDRIQSELNSVQVVEMAKSGIKFGIGGLEAVLKKTGLTSVDGWYSESCKDMSKYNRPLLRIYKRYYRKTNMSPIMELGMLMFGSLAWIVFQNKMGLRKSAEPAPSVSATAPSVPRAAAFEPPAPGKPPAMRPPTAPSTFRGPSWTSPSSAPTPSAPVSAPAPSAPSAPEPKADAQSEAILKMLAQMNEQQTLARAQQNALVEQLKAQSDMIAQQNAALAQQSSALAQQGSALAQQNAVLKEQSSALAAQELKMQLLQAKTSSSPRRHSPAGSVKSASSSPRLRVPLGSARRTGTAKKRSDREVIDL